MPWINKELCTGCGACANECRVEAISIEDNFASIDFNLCIRCGVCHSICPQDAVRHDGEKISEEIDANLDWVNRLMSFYPEPEEKKSLIGRLEKYFEKQKTVASKTIEKLDQLKNNFN